MHNDSHVENLMDKMHRAIVAGDFVQMQALTPELEAAVSGLKPDPARRSVARLQAKAKRNTAAALAAGKGVRAAIQRLAEVRENAAGLMTYDENGKRPASGGGGELSRRL